MLVAVPADLDARCARAMTILKILRVAHIQAACERLLITRPYAIVVGPDLRPPPSRDQRELLMSHAGDINASVVWLAEIADPSTIEAVVKEAVMNAASRRASLDEDDAGPASDNL